MGKLRFEKSNIDHSPHCENQDAPICGNSACKPREQSKPGIFLDAHEHRLWTSAAKVKTSELSQEVLSADENDTISTDISNSIHTSGSDSSTSDSQPVIEESIQQEESEPVKELLIIGAGPHALALLLRLLEPDPDFLSEGNRHRLAESTAQMRPIQEVKQHVKEISKKSRSSTKAKTKAKAKRTGTSTRIRPVKSKNKKHKNRKLRLSDKLAESGTTYHPPLSLDTALDSVQVIDANGDWLASWKNNFEAIGIPQLRSLMNAHADPYDHRSLEYYAEHQGRGDELVTLKDLTQRDKNFRGPYQVPTTRLFHDFHDALVQSYGVQDIVQKGKVISVTPSKDEATGEPIFEVQIQLGDNSDDGKGFRITTIRSKRCVCALGPSFNRTEHSWEGELRRDLGPKYEKVSTRILRSDEIVKWLLRADTDAKEGAGAGIVSPEKSKTHEEDKKKQRDCENNCKRVLIVGGGITSVQLAIRAFKASWCESVVFIQRSQNLQRHFDVENAWMGPKRGNLLEEFYSMQMDDRANALKDARRGGSIPPELYGELQRLEKKHSNLTCKEEVEISEVAWDEDKGEFRVMLNDDTIAEVDCIWLATGCQNMIDRHPILKGIHETLPINVVNGLPVLSPDLSWSSNECVDGIDGKDKNGCEWKELARKRIWCIGALAGLQLGADALNIVGARHGAVKVAKAIRRDMDTSASV